MKKTLSFLLVLAMVLSSFTAFAGVDTVAAEVQTHKAYIAGISDDTFAPKNNVTRQQVARMIAVANGLEKGTPEFKDANQIGNWAKDSVGALQKAGIVVGDEKGNFNPKDEVKRSELAMMLVKAYENIHGDIEAKDVSFQDVADDAWYAEAVKKAATVEIVAGVGNDKFNPNGNATREQAVAMVNRMLGLDKDKVENIDKLETEFKDVKEWSDWAKEDILLASTDFNFVEKDGKIVIVTEDVEEVKVEELEAVIAKAEKAAEDAVVGEKDGNYPKEAVDALKAAIKDAKAVLENKEATQEEVDKAAEELTAAIKTFEEKVVVVEELKVEEVSAINGKTVEIKFTNKLNPTTVNKTNIDLTKIDAISIVNSVTLDDTGKIVTLDLTGNELTNKDVNYVLNVDKVKDNNGNEIKEYSEVYTLSDKTRPTIGDISFADTQTIQFAVSEDIDPATLVDTNIKIYSANGINMGITDSEITHNTVKDVVEIDVASLTETGKYTLRAVGLKDLSGNLLSPNPTQKTFTVSEDKVAPKIVSIKNLGTDGTYGFIEVKFDEKIQADPAGNSSIDYFTVEVDGSPATSPTVTTTDDKTFVVNTTDLATEGLYNITIKDYKDLAGNAGSEKSQYITIAETAPEFVSAEYKTVMTGNKVVVKFDRDVNEDTFATIAATYITSDFVEGPATIAISALSVVDIDNDGIKELVIDADDYNGSGDALPGGKYTATLPAGLVDDVAGQSNKAQKVTFNVPEVPAKDQVEVDSISAPSQSGNEVTVTFTDKVDSATALNVNNYTIEGNKVFEKAVFTSTAKTKVKLTLKDDAIKESGDYILAINGVKDAKGNAVKAYSEEINLTETERPYMAKAEVTAKNIVVVTFNESLTGTVNEDDFNVTVNGKKVTPQTVSTSGAVSTITLADDLTSTSDVVVIETSDAFDGKDAAGNNGVKGQKITAIWK